MRPPGLGGDHIPGRGADLGDRRAIMIDLVVMRLTDMHRVHPQQDNSRVCGTCGAQVGIYPSGQAILRERPATRIVCSHCYVPARHDVEMLAPGAEREPFESLPAHKGKPRS
jgi:hypothetical protein